MANAISDSLAQFSQQIRAALPELRERYGVQELWLFGSYVRAEQDAGSDLDILVSFDNPHLSLLEFIQLEQELSELLGVKVDLVEKETLKPGVGENVLQEAWPV
jgi:predicted nucleotidyltransferase